MTIHKSTFTMIWIAQFFLLVRKLNLLQITLCGYSKYQPFKPRSQRSNEEKNISLPDGANVNLPDVIIVTITASTLEELQWCNWVNIIIWYLCSRNPRALFSSLHKTVQIYTPAHFDQILEALVDFMVC